MITNPFTVITPENITSEEIKDMFVENEDFSNLEKRGHTFIHGHRGCGKSMSLQVLRSKHYMLYKGYNTIEELPFLCMYMTVKSSVLANIELVRIKNDILEKYLAEHMLCLQFAIKICEDLINLVDNEELNLNSKEIKHFIKRLQLIGFNIDMLDTDNFLNEILQVFNNQWIEDNKIRRSMSFSKNLDDIVEPKVLTTYHDFLKPLIETIKHLDVSKKFNKDIYLLIDDADNLPEIFTKILNEWVSYRDIDTFSLKISTQLRYKTYLTTSNNRIERTHDYNEILFSYAVSSHTKTNYKNLVKDIIKKRLVKFEINSDVDLFFSEKDEQIKEIATIKEAYNEAWRKGKGRGNSEFDDGNRYARPDYIKKLGGISKQKSNYSYSGFNQLVSISSGIVRYFLEPASKMYEEQKNKNKDKKVDRIEPSVQNTTIRNLSNEYFSKQFSDLEKDLGVNEHNDEKIKKLKNLITSLGENFHQILISELSERRVFSFAISDDANVDKELKQILQLGIEYGLLFESRIGRKNSSGRTELYIFNRMLAPHFILDPNGFSGYQSLTTVWLKEAFINPNLKFKKLQDADISSLEYIQPTLPGL